MYVTKVGQTRLRDIGLGGSLDGAIWLHSCIWWGGKDTEQCKMRATPYLARHYLSQEQGQGRSRLTRYSVMYDVLAIRASNQIQNKKRQKRKTVFTASSSRLRTADLTGQTCSPSSTITATTHCCSSSCSCRVHVVSRPPVGSTTMHARSSESCLASSRRRTTGGMSHTPSGMYG